MIRRASGVSSMPVASAGRSERSARACARLATASPSLERGTISSTSFHSSARLPRTPSVKVQKTSAWSRRTRRLSTIQRTTPPRHGQLDYNHALAEVTGFAFASSGIIEMWMDLDKSDAPVLAGKVYVVGADISAGTGASNSVLVVGEAHSRHQVMEVSTPHMRPDEFAVLAVSICKWLGNAELIWEAPGPGRGFASKVFDLGYRNVWFPGKPKWRGALSNKKKMPGWNPVKDEKRELFEEYRRAGFDGDFLVQSRLQLDECRHFVYKPGGWIEHTGQSGGAILDPSGARENHGDRPTASALCWKRMVELVPHALTAPVPEPDLGYALLGGSASWDPCDLPLESSIPVPDGSLMARRIEMVRRREQEDAW